MEKIRFFYLVAFSIRGKLNPCVRLYPFSLIFIQGSVNAFGELGEKDKYQVWHMCRRTGLPFPLWSASTQKPLNQVWYCDFLRLDILISKLKPGLWFKNDITWEEL